MQSIKHNASILEETSMKFQLYKTNTKSRTQGLTCLEFPITSIQLNTECKNPYLSTNNAIDGMTILIVDLNFKKIPHIYMHADTIKQY